MIDPTIAAGIQAPDPLGMVAKLQQVKAAQQERQLRAQQITGAQQENQQRQMELQSSQAVMRAYQESNGDLDKTLPLAARYGATPKTLIELRNATIAQKEAALKLTSAQRADQLQQSDVLQGAHDQIMALPPEQRPGAYQQVMQHLSQMPGLDLSNAPPQYPGDQQFQAMGLGIRSHQQILADAEKQSIANKNNAEARKAGFTGEGGVLYDISKGQPQPVAGASQVNDPATAARLGVQVGASVPMAQVASVGHNLTEEGEQKWYHKNDLGLKARGQDMEFGGAALTPEATAMVSRGYKTTGNIPMMGRGAAANKNIANVLNTTAAQNPGMNPGDSQASFSADKDSLKELVAKNDQLETFSNTSLKNLKQALTALNAVRDTGQPWLNKPLRTLALRSGSPEQAAANAALQVVLPEFAKINSSPGLSGVLSDSARQEMASVITPGATLPQIKRVAQVLVNDAENRRTSNDQQIKAIKARISGTNTPEASPKPMTLTLPSGKKVTIE